MHARKFAIGLLSMGLIAVGFALAVQAPEFKPYASTDGRYKILFPGAVKTETVPIKTEKGEITLTVDSVELRAGTSFLVTYLDVPDDIAKLPAAGRLDKVRDGNKGENGKVLSDKDIAHGTEKYPGRDVLIERPENHLRNRIVIAGNRLYQVMAQGPKDVVMSVSVDRFLDSFEITK